ncbi:MAG: hypothetical protein KJ645_10615, partial [Planctomycetes bacterium]|nr:hypothetical protein [Planctomycetota bacterium]
VYDEQGHLIGTNSGGTWEAGVDGARPGITMWADRVNGASYYQEYYEGEAEDMAMIVAQGLKIKMGDGTLYKNCLQTLEWTALSPSVLEYKFYAPGVGMVMERHLGSDEVTELVSLF